MGLIHLGKFDHLHFLNKVVDQILKRKKLAWNFDNHMMVVNEINAVVEKDGSGKVSDKTQEIHSSLLTGEILWQLSMIGRGE
ncbi:hypothetical protein THIOSC13_840003 [uncultured Thiomicrorhabdus sp.]